MDKKKRELIPHKPGIYEKYIKRPQDFILSVIAIIVLSPVLVDSCAGKNQARLSGPLNNSVRD